MEGKRLIKKSILYFVGNMASKLLSTLLVPLYAFYIMASDLGYYDYSQTVMNIIVPIFFIAIWEGILRFTLCENSKERKEKVIGTSVWFVLLMSIILVLGILMLNILLPNNIDYMWYIIFMILANGYAIIWQYYCRALEKNNVYVIASVIGTVVNLVCNLVLICVLNMGIESLYLSYIMGQVAIVIFIEKNIKVISRLKIRHFDYIILKEMLRFSSPLVLNLISMWLISGFGRTIIVSKLGVEANGMYSFANKFVVIVNMIGSVITMAIIEEAIIAIKSKDVGEEFNTAIIILFNMFYQIIFLAIPILVIFYQFIKSTEYYDSLSLLPILLLYAVFMNMSSNIGAIFQVINKTKFQFVTTIIGAVVTVAVSYLLIGSLGMYAVIIGQCFGAGSMMISRYIFVNRYMTLRIKWMKISLISIVYIVLSYLYIQEKVIISIFGIIITLFIMFIINRKKILDLIREKNKS